MSRVKKILLSQMAEFRAEVARDVQMVVDDETDVGASRDGQDFFRHLSDFFKRRFLCAKLDEIAAAVGELLGDKFGRAAIQIGRVNEGIEFALRERFHEGNLTAKHAKHTKDSARGDARPTGKQKRRRINFRRRVN